MMADDADRALEDAELMHKVLIQEITMRAARMPKGAPGICKHCDEYFERLVGGHCGRCRDFLKLP